MKHGTLPISTVIPTRNRSEVLRRTLGSLAQQSLQPIVLIVTDASTSDDTEQLCRNGIPGLQTKIIYAKAQEIGAAAQRNQGVAMATQPFIWFCDDDIIYEPECMVRLWHGIQSDSQMGGVNAMIINQRYQSPGLASRLLFQLMNGCREVSYAGRVIGPAINLLPEDREDLPEVVPVEWMNTTCALYRREALPSPLFDSFFTGYSLMEDLALSLKVGQQWKLANVRTARIFHDSQPGDYKSDTSALAAMELVNRHYVMTKVLQKRGITDYLRLIVWESFQLSVCAARSQSRALFSKIFLGKLKGLYQLLTAFQRRSAKPEVALDLPVITGKSKTPQS